MPEFPKSELDKNPILYNIADNIDNSKGYAKQNAETLINVLDTLNKLTDLMQDMHINNQLIYRELKKRLDKENQVAIEENKQGWFY